MDHLTSIPIASLKICKCSYCMQQSSGSPKTENSLLFVWSPVFSWCAEPVCILASTVASSITTAAANPLKFSNFIYGGERENKFSYMNIGFIKVMKSTQTKILFSLIQIWHFRVLLPENILKSHIRVICNVLFLIYGSIFLQTKVLICEESRLRYEVLNKYWIFSPSCNYSQSPVDAYWQNVQDNIIHRL